MSPKKAPAKAAPWSKRAGRRGASVTAYERADRGGTVWLRWGWGGGVPTQRATIIRLRRDDGTIDPQAEAAALAVLAVVEAALAAGKTPELALDGKPEPGDISDATTLREGFDFALRTPDGHYAEEDANWRQAQIYSADLCEILGAKTLWTSIREEHAQKVWRAYARWSVEGKTRKVKQRGGWQVFPKGGHDTARRAVWWLFRAADIVARERGTRGPQPPRRWQSKLLEDWRRITSVKVEPARPRYTDAEVRKLMAVLPNADPRLRIAIEVGLEARLGQVTDATRLGLDIKKEAGVLGYGRLTVPDTEKKRASKIDLSKEQRALFDAAMAEGGYLFSLETARLRGKIEDYPLFPAGVLRGGVASAKGAKPWTSTGMRKAFLALEEAAGVEHVPDRGWYGLRRWAADRAEDLEKDERALNTLTGHSHTSTRRGYQEREATGPRKKAAEVRAKLRTMAKKKAPKGA